MARLIDTSVLIGVERRGGGLDDLRKVVQDEQIAIASITASELLAGYLRSTLQRRRSERLAYIESLFSAIPVIPFDLGVAHVHARLRFTLETAGQRIGEFDLMIASTALYHGYIMVTENRREFDRIPGLIVESPAWGEDDATGEG